MPTYVERSTRGPAISTREKNGVNTYRKRQPMPQEDRHPAFQKSDLGLTPPTVIYVKRSDVGQNERFTIKRANPDDLEYILKP